MSAERRGRWALLALATTLLAVAACSRAPAAEPRGTAVVIFVDFSQSLSGQDRAAFRREVELDILPSLGPGDRLLIAPIHDRTLTEFRPLVEVTLPARPAFNGWLDNVLAHNRKTAQVEAETARLRDRVKAEVAEAFARHYASVHTDILSSLLIAQKLFHHEDRRKVLVLMSDMIEDSPTYNFEKITWSPGAIETMLAELEARALIPKLAGVCVYVSGASARSAALAEHIGRFWQAYFARAGADLEPSRYARVLLHWPPARSCRDTRLAAGA